MTIPYLSVLLIFDKDVLSPSKGSLLHKRFQWGDWRAGMDTKSACGGGCGKGQLRGVP